MFIAYPLTLYVVSIVFDEDMFEIFFIYYKKDIYLDAQIEVNNDKIWFLGLLNRTGHQRKEKIIWIEDLKNQLYNIDLIALRTTDQFNHCWKFFFYSV